MWLRRCPCVDTMETALVLGLIAVGWYYYARKRKREKQIEIGRQELIRAGRAYFREYVAKLYWRPPPPNGAKCVMSLRDELERYDRNIQFQEFMFERVPQFTRFEL